MMKLMTTRFFWNIQFNTVSYHKQAAQVMYTP